MSDGHLSQEELRSLSDGLASADTERLRAHVSGCVDCARSLSQAGERSGDTRSGVSPRTVSVGPPRSAPNEGPPPLEKGACVGRYVILGRAGEGGMGVVYVAFDPELDRRVAIKLLHATGGDSQAWVLREAQAMARLSNPYVVAVHDVGTLDGDRVFIAMEFIEGQTVRQWVREKKPAWREVVRVFLDAGKGLAAAHAAGLVHRDFKPDNVLLAADGRARVMDFGVARASAEIEAGAPTTLGSPVDEEDSVSTTPSSKKLSAHLTQVGQVVGTLPYLAPELYSGAAADAASDQFSFAVALYESLYGEKPFARRSSLTQAEPRWRVRDAPKGARVPSWVRRAAVKGLSETPGQRYPSMGALLDELGRDPAATRRRVGAAAAAAVLLAATVGGARLWTQRQSQLCKGSEARLAGVWDDTARAQVQQAFLASGSPVAADALDKTSKRLDDYARAWVSQRTDACEATRLRGEQSEEALSLRMECLDRRLVGLASLVALLGQADKKVVSKSTQAAYELADLSACADVATLRARIPPPQRAEDRAVVEQQRALLGKAKALYDTGQFPQAKKIAQDALEVARKVTYPPLEAEALYRLGFLEASAAEPQAADTLQRAGWAALGVRDDALATDCAMRLAADRLNKQDLTEVQRDLAMADALSQRIGRPDAVEAQRTSLNGVYLSRTGHADEAITEGRRSIALYKKLGDTPKLATATLNLGVSLMEQGRFPEALEAYQQGYEVAKKTVGASHLISAQALLNLGAVLAEMGRFDRALEVTGEASRFLAPLVGKDSAFYAFNESNRGMALAETGRLDEAEQVLAQSLETEDKGGHLLAETLNELGRVYEAKGDYARALAQHERARALQDKEAEADGAARAETLSRVGMVQLALGDTQSAKAALDKAAELERGKKIRPAQEAETRFGQAKLLWATRGDKAQALSLAEQAREELRNAGYTRRADLVTVWLASVSASR